MCFLSAIAAAQQPKAINGTVKDSTGAIIQGATVEFRSGGIKLIAVTDEAGHFSIATHLANGTLVASYPAFLNFVIDVTARSSTENIAVVLTPAPNLQRLQVNGTAEDRIPAVPASQYAISEEQIAIYGSLVVDDILCQVPGFSTYRRSSSLFANPTSQGVSLRGVGSSATSRSTVLIDGILVNDPFGGWVYWARVPREGIESMEVSNGAASDLYGGGALGGVLNIRTRDAGEAYATAELSYGSLNTPDVSFAAGAPLGNWTISALGQAFQTGGYILAPPNQRGSVDTNANTGDLAGIVQVSHSLGEQGRFFVRGSGFAESRDNGTALQRNDTTIPLPALITRKKENLGETQARGFEAAGITPRIQVSASYLFVNSIVLNFPTQPGSISLVGLRLPQVPQNSFGVQASDIGRKWNTAVQARFLGNQFDDDQNLLPLGQAFSFDAQVSRQILPRTSIFFAMQNITNDRFEIAATPVTNVGPPIFVRGGMRFSLH